MNFRAKWNSSFSEISNLYHRYGVLHELSDSELFTLYILYDDKNITQGDIVAKTGLSKQTVNSAIGKLIKNGLVMLEESGHKSKSIVVTEKGQELTKKHVVPLIELEDSIFNKWSEEEKRIYLELNERYINELEKEIKKYEK